MSNKEIISLFRLHASLLDLHEENEWKIKPFLSAIFQLEKTEESLETKSIPDLRKLGFNQQISEKINEILHLGTFTDLQNLLDQTPKGILEVMQIKGLGAKKVRILWKELKIESLQNLFLACQENKVAKTKGFGEKTQENILAQIKYIRSNTGKKRYAEAEKYAYFLLDLFKKNFDQVLITGQIRRKLEIIDVVQLVVATESATKVHEFLNQIPQIQEEQNQSGVFAWRGFFDENNLKIEVKICNKKQFVSEIFVNSADLDHLNYRNKNHQTLLNIAKNKSFESESQIYQLANLPFIEPELREAMFEFELAEQNNLPKLLEFNDLKGSLHNHSTYSDGKNTLAQMAEYCKELGYEYLGIADHSKTAFYANGLSEERVRKQHQEIEELNAKLAPFKILKGIESDILNDGSLDYSDEILATFDFVVASVHSNLNMNEEKATQRLLKAISNPYTTILGHPTGRLLLRREGYPIDHQAVIDACAQHGVIIEINASPYRLDLDWRWVHYAIEKGVLLSINPDAHQKEAYSEMYYGVLVGRKGGLQKENTFNALNLAEIEAFLKKRKSVKGIDLPN